MRSAFPAAKKKIVRVKFTKTYEFCINICRQGVAMPTRCLYRIKYDNQNFMKLFIPFSVIPEHFNTAAFSTVYFEKDRFTPSSNITGRGVLENCSELYNYISVRVIGLYRIHCVVSKRGTPVDTPFVKNIITA